MQRSRLRPKTNFASILVYMQMLGWSENTKNVAEHMVQSQRRKNEFTKMVQGRKMGKHCQEEKGRWASSLWNRKEKRKENDLKVPTKKSSIKVERKRQEEISG